MVHLICLRCNRANASEAKFCTQCGAGLLRKFCSKCHAVNDAESHFCQSCGGALPTHPSVAAAAPMLPPAVIPDLTDVYRDPDEAPFDMPPSELNTSASDDPPAPAPTLSTALARPAPPVSPRARSPVLFGFVGGAVVLLAAALWSRTDHPNVAPSDAGASASPSLPSPAAVAATPTPAPTPAASPVSTGIEAAPRSDGADPAVRAVAAKETTKSSERRLQPEAQIAARPPAAGPAPRSGASERAPLTHSAPPSSRAVAPPPECTPQVDALGLCAPGAKAAGK